MNPPDSVSSATFYRVDGTHFAFGLEWMTAAANKQSIDQARAAAKKQKATHAAWRLTKAQVGLTRVDQDVPERSFLSPWRSAAAAFADLPYSSLLAAFKFRDGRTWVLAATNGRIYAKGDRVFVIEEEARRYFDELFAQQYWNDIFAPADWHSRAKQIDPLAVLRRKRPEGRVAGLLDGIGATLGVVNRPGTSIKPLVTDLKSIEKPKLIAAAALCLVAAGGMGYVKWRTAHTRKPQIAAPSPYYPTIAAGSQTLALCIKALLDTVGKHQTPGWTLTEATCSGDRVVATLALDPDIPATTMMAFHPEAEMRTRKQAAIESALPAAATQETLMLPLATEDAYQNAFAVADERSNSTNVIGPVLPPSGVAPTQNGRQRPRPYRVSQWSFDTTAPPLMWAPDLAAIRNLDVASVTLAISEHGLSWKIKGNAYVVP